MIYNGPTGQQSADLVRFFEGIEGVPNLQKGISPATWMLDISTVSAEERLGRDFADIFYESELFGYAAVATGVCRWESGASQHALPSLRQHDQSVSLGCVRRDHCQAFLDDVTCLVSPTQQTECYFKRVDCVCKPLLSIRTSTFNERANPSCSSFC